MVDDFDELQDEGRTGEAGPAGDEDAYVMVVLQASGTRGIPPYANGLSRSASVCWT